MQSKPKILVLKMRELVYTGIFLFLAVVLIVLLVLMFRTEKAPGEATLHLHRALHGRRLLLSCDPR